MVGSAKFEFATSASQTQNHTKLDHDPSEIRKCPNLSFTDNNFKGKRRIKSVTIENYVKAGKIAAEVREMIRIKDLVGKTVYDICEG